MKLVPFILFTLFAVVGCAHRSTTPVYEVYVEAITDIAVAPGSTFTIISGMKEVSSDDLAFRKNAEVVSKALQELGHKPSEKGDITIQLAYSIGEPTTHTYSRVVPKYGVSSVNNSYGQRVGSVSGFSPTTVVESEDRYKRHLLIRAFRQNKELWRTEAVSEGWSNDLTKAIPFMVKAAYPYFGQNTDGKVLQEVAQSEESLHYLRKPASN